MYRSEFPPECMELLRRLALLNFRCADEIEIALTAYEMGLSVPPAGDERGRLWHLIGQAGQRIRNLEIERDAATAQLRVMEERDV